MNKIKGLRKLNNAVNGFLKPFDCCGKLGIDFCYVYSTSTIYYGLIIPDEDIEADFQASIDRLHPRVKMDTFIWSLLHELGHHETLDTMEQKEIDYCNDIKAKINNEEIDASEYYDLLDERLATEWAVNYANTHALELKKWWEKVMQPAIMNFYKKNKIEG